MRAALWLVLLAAACTAQQNIDPSAMDDATFERELARRFQYEPPQPPPAEVGDQRAGQIADAEYFRQFPGLDRAYTARTRAQAQRMADQLAREAGDLTHEQFVLRIAEIAALADNAHTSIGENAFRKNTTRLPLRTYLFEDGLHVTWAKPEFRDLLGARIDSIDGRSIAQIYAVIRRYEGGTEAHRRATLTPMLESPALLQAAGVAEARDALTLTGVLLDGTRFERRIATETRDRSAWVSSTARQLFPTADDAPMVSLLRNGPDLPVFLQHRTNLFSAEPLPQRGLYIGIGYNADADEGPIGAFLDAQLARVRGEHPAFVVVDMRMNTGGDYTTTYAFARALPEAAGGAHIYVLTSAWTFSAAITTVAALKDAGGDQVSIVGAPVGDRLDFWAEGGTLILPNAFVEVHYAAGRHVYNAPCRDTSQCFWLNARYPVRVRTLAPDIAAPLTFAAYRENRDPALEAVLAHEIRNGSSARRR